MKALGDRLAGNLNRVLKCSLLTVSSLLVPKQQLDSMQR